MSFTSLLPSLFSLPTGLLALGILVLFTAVTVLLHSYGQQLRCQHCGATATQFDGRTGRALCEACADELTVARTTGRRPAPPVRH